MRAANVRLAQAIEAEHGYGPRVTEAIDETHEVMGTLQKETLQHLFAMRGVLNPDQAEMFDKRVVKALTPDERSAPTYRNVAPRNWPPLPARTAKKIAIAQSRARVCPNVYISGGPVPVTRNKL